MKRMVLITLGLVLGVLIGTSSAVEVTLFGPAQYLRTTGSPNLYTDTFPGVVGQGKLILKNGEANGKNRVSSAWVLINGQQVLGPNSFNQQVYNIEVPVNLSKNNSISVQLQSKPGSCVTIQILEEIQAQAGAVIGNKGGTLDTPDGYVAVVVPPESLPSNTIVTISYPDNNLNFGQIGKLVELGPDGLSFQAPITLILKYDPAAIPANVSEYDLFAGRLGDFDTWEILEGSQVDLITKEVEVDITHLSTYGILYSVNANVSTFKLKFPLQGYTPFNTPISSVFDHSSATSYQPDGKVVAFTGESAVGIKNATGNYINASSWYYQSGWGKCFGFNGSNTDFYVNGDYTGGGEANFLFYDGHPGIDFAVNQKVVLAAADGIVHYGNQCAGNTWLNEIWIDHGNGYKTRYLHLLQRSVSDNTKVKKGDVIGISGQMSCDLSKPNAWHLHFEVQYNNVPVDPYGWSGSYPDPYKVSNINLWEGENPPPPPSQNLLTNPEFDGSLEGWSLLFGPPFAVYDPTLNAPGSVGGSAKTINDVDQSNNPYCTPDSVCVTTFTIAQWVRVMAGTSYDYGGEIFIPVGQLTSGYGEIGLAFWDNNFNFIPSGVTMHDVTATGVWTFSGGTVQAPSGAVWARIVALNGRIGPVGSHQVNFDHIFFQQHY